MYAERRGARRGSIRRRRREEMGGKTRNCEKTNNNNNNAIALSRLQHEPHTYTHTHTHTDRQTNRQTQNHTNQTTTFASTVQHTYNTNSIQKKKKETDKATRFTTTVRVKRKGYERNRKRAKNTKHLRTSSAEKSKYSSGAVRSPSDASARVSIGCAEVDEEETEDAGGDEVVLVGGTLALQVAETVALVEEAGEHTTEVNTGEPAEQRDKAGGEGDDEVEAGGVPSTRSAARLHF
jgi:hypothetical protein